MVSDTVVVSEEEIKRKLRAGWVFPLVLAKRWGVKELTVRVKAYQGKLIHVRTDRGLMVLDPNQAYSGKE